MLEFRDVTIAETDFFALDFKPSDSQASVRKDAIQEDYFLYIQAWPNVGGKIGTWKYRVYAEVEPFLGRWELLKTGVISTRDQLYELDQEVFE